MHLKVSMLSIVSFELRFQEGNPLTDNACLQFKISNFGFLFRFFIQILYVFYSQCAKTTKEKVRQRTECSVCV